MKKRSPHHDYDEGFFPYRQHNEVLLITLGVDILTRSPWSTHLDALGTYVFNNFINDTVIGSFSSAHEVVTICIFLNPLQRLT